MRYSITPETNPSDIPRNAEFIHLVRPLREKKLLELIRRCRLREISLSRSCSTRLSAKARRLIRENRVSLKEGQKRGRPIGIALEKLRDIVEMHREDRSYRDIEGKLGIPKSTAHYLIRYAARTKLREGSRIVYLE